ncbi:expressed unknown protein (Partial), partial [Seminavis robusta]|eukprot:Sro3048_g342810.1 n/a (111) ;mRNA; r:2-513
MSSDARIRSAAGAAAANSKKQKMSPPFDSLLFADDLILVQGIFPFVGVGQYAFVGAVNKKMNQLYKEYCKIELNKNPRKLAILRSCSGHDKKDSDGINGQVHVLLKMEIWK